MIRARTHGLERTPVKGDVTGVQNNDSVAAEKFPRFVRIRVL